MCTAGSKAERFSKISIVIKETDETLFGLKMLEKLEYVQKEIMAVIKTKTEEILKVTSSCRKMLKN
ncbi:four helix bundle protein [Chryseobacterium culicis]|uniref:four helix bundle protein n=1 Tax=Chryseobacterium culicis TaxID=680127 RepID=UPI00187592EB|nr:four helix bundle protein [Chryseobacterium culicis]MBE4950228.1 four helix bundle protein [Chryseobacterium culicis]